MSRRRYRLRPPTSADYIVGETIEYAAEDDRVNAGKPLPPVVELTPVGPPATVFEFRPEDDKVGRQEITPVEFPTKSATMIFDAAGNPTATINALGYTTYTHTYNAANQLTAITDARGNCSTYLYDAAGRVVTTTVDLLGRSTVEYSHHAMGTKDDSVEREGRAAGERSTIADQSRGRSTGRTGVFQARRGEHAFGELVEGLSGIGETLNNLGLVQWEMGQLEEAAACFKEALATYRQFAVSS